MTVEVSSIVKSYKASQGEKIKMGGIELSSWISPLPSGGIIFCRIPNGFLSVCPCSGLGYVPPLAEREVKDMGASFSASAAAGGHGKGCWEGL